MTTSFFAPIIHNFVMFRAQNNLYNSNFAYEYLEICLFHEIDPNLAGHHCPFASSWANIKPTAITNISKIAMCSFISLIANVCSSGHKKVLDNSPMPSILSFVRQIPSTNKGGYGDIDGKVSSGSSGNHLTILMPNGIVPGTGWTFIATLLYARHCVTLSYIKDDARTTFIRKSFPPFVICPSLSIPLITNIPFLNLSPILSFVGTNTCLFSFSESKISTSILLSVHSIFPSFTSFCHSLPSNNWYSAGCTMNACVYVFTSPTSNSKYSTYLYNSSFLPFAVCIVIFLFLFTSNPSLSHRSSQMITISDPTSNNPNSCCLPITTTSISRSGATNSSRVPGIVTKVAPTTDILFCIYV